jgi:hypothetical protein
MCTLRENTHLDFTWNGVHRCGQSMQSNDSRAKTGGHACPGTHRD